MEQMNEQTQNLISELRKLINGAQELADSFIDEAIKTDDRSTLSAIRATTITNLGILAFLMEYESTN